MKDTQGREWLFRFTARTVRELAAETHLDTKALDGENSLLQRVAKDESILYTVMWITIRPQAQSLGVTEDEWFDSLDNVSIHVARAGHDGNQAARPPSPTQNSPSPRASRSLS